MITIVISGPSFAEAKNQVLEGNRKGDLLEFRLDLFTFSDYEKIRELRESAELPVIFTLRRASDEGGFEGSESERLMTIQQYASLSPDYIDLEHDVELPFLEEIHALLPLAKIITSYHHFFKTPEDLQGVYQQMRNPFARCYKIATMAQSSLDTLRMLRFLQLNREQPIVGLCMGELGQPSRILAPVFGSLFTYASGGMHGQLEVEALRDIYHYDRLGTETKVLGLIGHPVSQSPGHLSHNHVIRELGLDAVYVKMPVAPAECKRFLALAQELGLLGLSVTIPLKEEVLGSVSGYFPEEVGAVNTLRFSPSEIEGLNTDGAGALDAIEEHMKVDGKRVLIAGAGGAAKGVAFEAHRRGAHVCIMNRTKEKAKSLAERIGCEWGGFDDYFRFAEKGYDVIVNGTSSGLHGQGQALPFLDEILEGVLAMDVVYRPMETPFLQAARSKGCTLVYGMEMFVLQAVKQFGFWFGEAVSESRVKKALETAIQAGNLP